MPRNSKTVKSKETSEYLKVNNMTTRVLNEIDFIKIGQKRTNDAMWTKIECIQSCVKSSSGVGKHFMVSFKCDSIIKIDDIFEEEIRYNWRKYDCKFKMNLEKECEKRNRKISEFPFKDI